MITSKADGRVSTAFFGHPFGLPLAPGLKRPALEALPFVMKPRPRAADPARSQYHVMEYYREVEKFLHQRLDLPGKKSVADLMPGCPGLPRYGRQVRPPTERATR